MKSKNDMMISPYLSGKYKYKGTLLNMPAHGDEGEEEEDGAALRKRAWKTEKSLDT